MQPALGGNSQTAIICTMTQTFQNYQETVNTLLFGQKAKNIKTTVAVNEIAVKGSTAEVQAELERAKTEITQLRGKLKSGGADGYLHEQLTFVGAQLDALKAEVSAKDTIIEKIMQEKTELKIQFDQFAATSNQQSSRINALEAKLEEADKGKKNMQLLLLAQKVTGSR